MADSSRIFLSNRALGYVSNHVPLVTRYIMRRRENLIVTCVGKAFHTYGCSHFSLLSVSGLHSDDISCLAADTYHIYTACGDEVYAWRRGTELKHTYKGHRANVHLILPFGPHLLSVDEDNCLFVWDIKDEEVYLNLKFDKESFTITTIVHPSTYINKMLFGSEQGKLQLWNIKTATLIYSFTGWNSSVTALEQSTAIDVVGIGLANGHINLHNLKYDQTVMTFIQDWGAVTSISFRLDDVPIMVTGSPTGHIVLWDLEKKCVASQLLKAHFGTVTGMQCLPSEPLMVTSSPDNSLKLWIFDMPDGGARLLRLREGHAAPPTFIRFHGNDGHNILSAGKDSSMRIFNTISETFNKSMGRASYNRKLSKKKGRLHDTLVMPPISEFASETTRDKEWDSIAAIHQGLPVVTTWSYDKIKMGDLKLLPGSLKNSSTFFKPVATCVTLTNCGNFVIIGYNCGLVERFNIQSGIHRCSYGETRAHEKCIRGVAVDNLNQIVITGGADKLVKFWYFKLSHKPPIAVLKLEEPVNFFRSHKVNSVLCIALEDFSILLLDLDTKKIIRKFVGHSSAITDASFSPDARWLVTASMDLTIRTWDIPSGQLIDCFRVSSVCISLSFSLTGEFLATAHVGNLGISLWSNRTLFSHVSLRPLPADAEFPLMAIPHAGQTEPSHELQEDNLEPEFQSAEQIDEHLISLSGLASSRWQNLLDIDIIKKRNKPKEPPKAPKAAPFFLPTLPTQNLQFDFSSIEKSEDGFKTLKLDNIKNNYSVFGKLLEQCGLSGNYEKAISKLKSMSPSAVDFEVNTLSIEGGGSVDLMLYFMKMILSLLHSYKDFELGQSYLGLFLKVHGEFIATTPKLSSIIEELQSAQENGWNRLQNEFLYCMSVVDTLKIS